MNQTDILMVEDDPSLGEVTCDFLRDHGYAVTHCTTGSAALEAIKSTEFKLVILDINLPDLLGFDICTLIRKHSKVPIIFLSARISDTDKIKGLELGGDDYISKPYSLNELLSRIKAQIRRKYDYDSTEESLFTFGSVQVDFPARKVLVDGAERDMPAKEFELLAYLIRNRNKSISKEVLFNEIWGLESLGEISTLSVHIRRLREKIEKNPSDPQYIKTVWSFGYRFEV